jgi:hypothetical protein
MASLEARNEEKPEETELGSSTDEVVGAHEIGRFNPFETRRTRWRCTLSRQVAENEQESDYEANGNKPAKDGSSIDLQREFQLWVLSAAVFTASSWRRYF